MTEVKAAVTEYFDGIEEDNFRNGVEKRTRRWTKCVDLTGDYLKKIIALNILLLSSFAPLLIPLSYLTCF